MPETTEKTNKGMTYSLPYGWTTDDTGWSNGAITATSNTNNNETIVINFFDCQDGYDEAADFSGSGQARMQMLRLLTVNLYLSELETNGLLSDVKDTEIAGHPARTGYMQYKGTFRVVAQVLVSPLYSAQILYNTDASSSDEANEMMNQFLSTISFEWNDLPE